MKNILREYVREVLKESANVDNFAVFVIKNIHSIGSKGAVLVDVSLFKKNISAYLGNESMTKRDALCDAAHFSVVGFIVVEAPRRGNAWGAWEVVRSVGKGYGKIIYAIGYALTPNGLLMPDRSSVSDDAANAWKKASKTHDFLVLDPLPPMNKTDSKEDDAKVHNEEGKEYLDRAYKAQGWEKGMLDRLVQSGEELKEEIKSILGNEDVDSVISCFTRAGPKLFNREYNA